MSQPHKPAGRPRTGARVAAVQALFQSEQSGESAETVADQFIRHRIGTGEGAQAFEDGTVPLAHVPLFQAILRSSSRRAEDVDAEIRARLQREGLTELNRSLPPPWDYNAVLVVAPQGAAGLGDFQAEADRLQRW